MKRVAALCLPMWPVERLWRAERTAAPPEAHPPASLAPLAEAATTERESACSVPRGGGWRPGARWAQEHLPARRRPKTRELGRCDEAAAHPFAREARSPSSPSPLPDAQPAPLVTALRSANRMIIAAACPRARALGIRPGMTIAGARAQLPGLDVRPADPRGDDAALRALALFAARRWSPLVMRDGDDALLLDVTGVAHLFGGESAMAARIVRLLGRAGFTARVAIADTGGAALAIARHAREAVTRCPPGSQAQVLAPLPVAALRIDEKPVELLHRLGVDCIGQLAAMPRAPLVRRFGVLVAQRLEQALGALPEPFDPIVPVDPIVAVRRFAEPIATAEAIGHWIGNLVAELAEGLAAAGLGARRVELVADRIDGVPQRIVVGLARASRDPVHLGRLVARRIETIAPGYGIDALTLHVRRAEPLGPEPCAERLDTDAAPDLAPLVDTLATRIGAARIWRTRAVESDVPERSVTRAAPIEPPAPAEARLRPDDVRRLDRAGILPPWHPRWPRPVRLLRRPERIDDVVALLPDQPPRRFTWRGVTHRVVRADGPERIHGEWWKRMAEAHATRDYFRVEDEEGRRYWLFRRGDGERAVTGDLSWYLHGVFG